ncbi:MULTISPECIES: DUF6152 family protein [unclassified Novosphingobium]|uniref:DUF6152 family protein n=1 Tax=Novosphingobium TaxID=165696 RepID=UPI00146BDDD9|nr:hypothetical protein [Novosphingobium sp. SG919]NMN85413.1 hypothetical protein [Novosphingobium sp. SG916]
MKVFRLPRFPGLLETALIVAGGPALALVAAPASAHHSAAPFDMTKKVVVSGTVEKWVWSNPHSWLYLRSVKPDGTQVIWGFEAGSAGMLARSGWNSHDMKAGDKVTVSGFPSRNGKPVGLINEVRLSTGRVLGSGFGAAPGGGLGGPGGPGSAPHPR